MIKVKIDCWKLENLFTENLDLYERLYALDEKSFIMRAKKFERNAEGKINQNYQSTEFYINDLKDITLELLKYCEFELVHQLEMMGGAKINTENVFEAVKKNQIMLPNNLMLDMKELMVETNACTNSINESLKEGWKLIAILPQHQQARPDYILGKL